MMECKPPCLQWIKMDPIAQFSSHKGEWHFIISVANEFKLLQLYVQLPLLCSTQLNSSYLLEIMNHFCQTARSHCQCDEPVPNGKGFISKSHHVTKTPLQSCAHSNMLGIKFSFGFSVEHSTKTLCPILQENFQIFLINFQEATNIDTQLLTKIHK